MNGRQFLFVTSSLEAVLPIDSHSHGVVKDPIYVLQRYGAALYVLQSAYSFRHFEALLVRDWLLFTRWSFVCLLLFFLFFFLVVVGAITTVDVCSNKYDRDIWAVVAQLGVPRRPNIFEPLWVHDAETDQEDISVGIRKGPQPRVFFLPGRVPQTYRDCFAIDIDVRRIIVEDCWDVVCLRSFSRVRKQKVRLNARKKKVVNGRKERVKIRLVTALEMKLSPTTVIFIILEMSAMI